MELNRKLVILYFWSLLFPAGIWTGLEGYEILAIILLSIGFAPTAVAVALYLAKVGE